MKKLTLNWKLGCMNAPDIDPEEMFPAEVPGAVQIDYARAKNLPDPNYGLNFRQYKGLENLHWLYTAPLDFALKEDEMATVEFLGIDYRESSANQEQTQ